MAFSETRTANLAEVAAMIREVRQRIGVSQEKFAAKVGVSFPTVSRWERQKVIPSPLALDRIKELLQQMGDRGADLLNKYFPEEV